MGIEGIGVDIVEIERFKKIIEKILEKHTHADASPWSKLSRLQALLG